MNGSLRKNVRKGISLRMKTDIQIAQEAVMEPITEVAKKLHIDADDLELYGKFL